MTTPTKLNITILQGNTFLKTIRWESSDIVYRTITGITNAAPMVITAPSHGLLAGWRAYVSNAVGMTEVNSLGYIVATSVDSNTITFNNVNSSSFKSYISDGILIYNLPMDLTGYTARMQIREKLSSTTTILDLTTENFGIILNNTNKTISISISDTATSALDFKSAVYSLEMVSPSNIVTTILYGNVSLNKEVTR